MQQKILIDEYISGFKISFFLPIFLSLCILLDDKGMVTHGCTLMLNSRTRLRRWNTPYDVRVEISGYFHLCTCRKFCILDAESSRPASFILFKIPIRESRAIYSSFGESCSTGQSLFTRAVFSLNLFKTQEHYWTCKISVRCWLRHCCQIGMV